MESPRRYPRSLEQAFGPYTSRHIHVDAPRAGWRAWAAYLLVVAIALACAVLAGCTKAEAAVPDGMMGLSWGGIGRTAPDDYGVVCYSKNGQTLSCVKVK